MTVTKRISALALILIMMISIIPVTVFAGSDKNGWQKEGDYWYYYRDNEKVTNDWIKDGGKWYYLSEDGSMAVDQAVADSKTGKFYIVDKSGAMVTKAGWVKVVDNGNGSTLWYYLKKGGEAVKGWKKLSSKWYYFSGDSAVMVSSISYPDGYMIGNKMYFFNKDGSMKTKCWIEDSDGFWYYVGKNGEAVTGWQKIGKKWYCFFESGRMMYKDWVEEPEGSGNWYYLGEDGVMVVDSLVNSLGELYYQGKDGRGIAGWKKVDGNWYYFNPDKQGAAVKDCTIQIGSMWYTFDSNCICTNPEGSSEEPAPAPATASATSKPIELPFVPADAL